MYVLGVYVTLPQIMIAILVFEHWIQKEEEKVKKFITELAIKGHLDTGENITAIISCDKFMEAMRKEDYVRCELLVNGNPI